MQCCSVAGGLVTTALPMRCCRQSLSARTGSASSGPTSAQCTGDRRPAPAMVTGRRNYSAMVLYMDDTVGAIVQGLRCPTGTGRRGRAEGSTHRTHSTPGTHSTRSIRGTHSTRSPIECLRCTRHNANPTRMPLTIDSHLRESRARPIPLASLRRERAMWETTLFVILADNGGPICTLTALRRAIPPVPWRPRSPHPRRSV